jgi:hypothetical protein
MHRTPTSLDILACLRTIMPAEDERANIEANSASNKSKKYRQASLFAVDTSSYFWTTNTELIDKKTHFDQEFDQFF